MKATRRDSRSYSIDRQLHAYVVRTRGRSSTSQRLNDLLRRAVREELYDELDREAAKFYGSLPARREEERAFQKATRRSLSRD